jgi:aspartate racemase
MKTAIKDGLERLESFGVDIMGIPCNSAHNYYEFITQKIKVPTLNIVDETVKNIQDNTKVTIFATEMTLASGLYQER